MVTVMFNFLCKIIYLLENLNTSKNNENKPEKLFKRHYAESIVHIQA